MFVNLLSCGQQHEQTDEAVLQCVEVLQAEKGPVTATHTLQHQQEI